MRRGVLLQLAALAAALVCAPPAGGAEYWVDQGHPEASDANPGTGELPWLTIGQSAGVAVAGDTVHVRQGTYEERVEPANSGEEGSPITFVAEPRRSVEMAGFNTEGSDWLRIEGFTITSMDPFDGWDEAQGVLIRSNHVEVVDNYIHHVRSTAIAGYWHDPFPDSAHVADNTIYHVQMGITVNGTNWIVERNEVNRLYMYGGGDCDYSRFFGEGHIIRLNFFHGTDFDEIGDAHVDCFQTFTNNGEVIRDILFEGNVCTDFHQGLMASNVEHTDTRDFTFRNNVFAHGGAWGICVHDVPGIVVENNTFAFIQYHGAGFRDDSTGNVVRNNIFYEVSSSYWASDGGEVTGDHNLIFNAGAPDVPGEHDLLDVDPLFLDPANDIFMLRAGSPAVDAGMDLPEVDRDVFGTGRPQGGGWDIGAYEWVEDPDLTIATVSLPAGEVGEEYAAALRAVGGSPPTTWSVTGGGLPAGLGLESGDGSISGTPESGGMFTFTARVTDGASGSDSRSFSITVLGGGGQGRGCGCVLGPGREGRSFLALLIFLVLWVVAHRRIR